MSPSTASVVVLDNGGGLCKAGFGGDCNPVAVVPNSIGRSSSSSGSKKSTWLVADQIHSPDVDVMSMHLRRPFDRGYLTNPDLQRDIWDRLLRSLLRADPSRSSLLLVEHLFCPNSVQRATDELVFEDFGFSALHVADPASLVHLYEASRRHRHHCSLVVDCGFSFTHAAPVLGGFTLNYGVRRMDLGGKALTNYLKELVSYRSVNVMDETLLIDDAKEKLCFVSMDVPRDLELARRSAKENPLRCTYVLPDGVTHTKGFVKDLDAVKGFLSFSLNGSSADSGKFKVTSFHEDYRKVEDKEKIDSTRNEFSLTNERFLVPEMLFYPADLGINQAGLAECIIRAVESCHPHLQPLLYERIILTGGSTLFPQFAERLEKELRPLVPDDYTLKIITQEDPILGVWKGGSLLASSPDFESTCITKFEYEEMGSLRTRQRFFH